MPGAWKRQAREGQRPYRDDDDDDEEEEIDEKSAKRDQDLLEGAEVASIRTHGSGRTREGSMEEGSTSTSTAANSATSMSMIDLDGANRKVEFES